MRTLREIRERSYAVACAALAGQSSLGVEGALVQLEGFWAQRAARHLHASPGRVALGYDEARAAILRLCALPPCAAGGAPPAPRWHCPTCEALFWARHHLTIYVKLTALPVETGGFGVEVVLE